MNHSYQTIIEKNNGTLVYTQAPILLNCLSYDGIGRLIGKNIGGSVVNNTLTYAENLTMSYNPRNWLTSINGKSAKNDPFQYSLQYTEAGQFNGNIGKMILNDRATSYTYDGINRLTLADGLDAAGKQMKEQISYDLNGNILSLNRTMGGVQIDNLAYSYKPNSNQLQAVTDIITSYNGLGYNDVNKKTDDFKYDNNGSMTSDLDKSLTLTYNRLNLVQTAQINSSKQVYLYNTQGNKMAQKVGGQYKAYLFGSEYVNDTLVRMQTAEGFVSKNLNWKDGSTEKKYPYSFTISDHLGNIRVVVDEQGTLLQKNEYTAFGVVQSTGPSKNKYLFNNKELQTGTQYLDYGARMYQPELGRWNVVDPLAQKYGSYSPYNFTLNNPLRFVDPDGREAGEYFNEKGKKIGDDGKNDNKIFVIRTTKTTEQLYGGNSAPKGKSNSISQSEASNTENQIKKGDFSGGHMNNLVKLQSFSNMSKLLKIANKDDGKGGDAPGNNREYNAVISNGVVKEGHPGAVSDPTKGMPATVQSTVGKNDVDMHTHPSGSKRVDFGNGQSGTAQWGGTYQAPSSQDIRSSNSNTNYVFGMRDQTIYMYNNQGVSATVPISTFSNP